MQKLISFFLILLSVIVSSQNIKVTYNVDNNGFSDVLENVYINNNYKISIKDSIPVKIGDQSRLKADVVIADKSKIYRNIVIDDLKKKDVYYTHTFKGQNFLVLDVLPDIKWKIDSKTKKKIGKYNCTKATTTYRGTDIEAYFTTEIPVSLAPNKISGLPGLVMEMRTFGENYTIWSVKNIVYPYKGEINYSPKYINSLKRIDIKKLVQLIDEKNEDDFNIQQSKLKLPAGVKVASVSVTRINPRNMLETKFEWEK